MSEPKQPEDKKPKAKKPVDEVKAVVLDGHEYKIDPAVFDDVKALELQEDGKFVSLLRLMLGPEQWAQFYDNHANEQGRVTGAKMQQITSDLQASGLGQELGKLLGLDQLLKARYGAVEADFQRFYQLDIAGVYSGSLSLRRAGRLVYELPPEAAIFRGSELDQRVLSEESFWLRALFNIWVEEKDRVKLPSEMAEQMAKREAQVRKAEAMHARQQGGVSRG